MGFGDELMGAGLARGLRERGKRAAFGDGKRIVWARPAHEIFRDNPNVAAPGSEGASDLVWIRHYPGARAYHATPNKQNGMWRFNPAFRATPGEMFFSDAEIDFAKTVGAGFVVVEPNVKPVYPNKRWPWERWVKLIGSLAVDTRQFAYPGARILPNVATIEAPSFRHAVAVLANAAFAIVPEGGLHHAAAAVGTPAVVLFGGHTDPKTTGYDGHRNIFTGKTACGSNRNICSHCTDAMAAISVEMVAEAARECAK